MKVYELVERTRGAELYAECAIERRGGREEKRGK
jgi:hypothetical protein